MELLHPLPKAIISLFTQIRQCFGFLLAGLIIFFLLGPLVETHTHMRDIAFRTHWGLIAVSFGFLLLSSNTCRAHLPHLDAVYGDRISMYSFPTSEKNIIFKKHLKERNYSGLRMSQHLQKN